MTKAQTSQWGESANSYYFRVNLPNFSSDNIKVDIKEGKLTILAIKGKKFEEENEGEDGEEPEEDEVEDLDPATSYQHSFQLPIDKVHFEGVHAFMDQGHLVIKMPKLKPENYPSMRVKLVKPKL